MSTNVFLNRLRRGEVLLGLCNMYPSPGILEGMCKGWDFVWIDGQHGQIGYADVGNILRAAAVAQVQTLLRTPGCEPGMLGQYADLSPSAVMVPMINNATEAQAVVQALRFPPLGERSYGGRRVIDLYGRDYFHEAELAVVAQIETQEAVANAEAIIGTEGVDMLFFGPDDMKVRLGIGINTSPFEDESLRSAMRRTAEAARGAGKFACCIAASAATLKAAVEMGYQVIVGGGDIGFMRAASASKLAELRELAGERKADKPTGAAGDVYGG